MYLLILFEGIDKSIPFNSVLNIAISDHFTANEKVAPRPNILDFAPPPSPPPPNIQNLPTTMTATSTEQDEILKNLVEVESRPCAHASKYQGR